MNKIIESLINQFASLPRIGRKAAQKMVIHLLQENTGKIERLKNSLISASENIKPCVNCGVLTDSNMCSFCQDNKRENGQLCLVRDLNDVIFIEKTNIFNGRYHILGGCLSGVDGLTPDDLNINNLKDRIKFENIKELIFVLPNTIDGKTTMLYIKSLLSDIDVKFSELASGVPIGGDLDYLDDGTIAIAFGERKNI